MTHKNFLTDANGYRRKERISERKKNLAPSSILREAKVAYYARNMFEAGRFVLFFVKAT